MTGASIVCAAYLNSNFYWQESLPKCMCYIHPDGVEVPDAALKLCKLAPKRYALQLIKSEVCYN